MTLSGENVRRLIELAVGPLSADPERARPTPPPGAPLPPRRLTIGITTAGDFAAVHLTLAALRLGSVEAAVWNRVSIEVIDSRPRGAEAWSLKALEWDVPGLRYVPAGDVSSWAAAKDRVFHESTSDWVLCLDAPVLLAPDALRALLDFVDAQPDCADLLQGPRLDDGLARLTTHWRPAWHGGVFGVAELDGRGVDPDGDPFEIPMQDLGLFACRRTAWLGFNPAFRGRGGEEGYLHERFRSAGRLTRCLPFLRWVRRPTGPADTTYRPGWEDRMRNHLIGWEELGWPLEPVVEHFREQVGAEAADNTRARWETAKANPFSTFGGILCINLDSRADRWERMYSRFEVLGIADRVRRLPGIETPSSYHVGCALSHRRALDIARREGMDSVLVFEDDAVFLQGALWVLRRSLAELAGQEWTILYLGSYASPPFPLAEGCHHLEVVRGLWGTHAIAYHRRVFDRLLDTLPESVEAMGEWVREHQPIDLYIADNFDEGLFRVSPMVASQEMLVHEMPHDLRDQFGVVPAPAPPVGLDPQANGRGPALVV